MVFFVPCSLFFFLFHAFPLYRLIGRFLFRVSKFFPCSPLLLDRTDNSLSNIFCHVGDLFSPVLLHQQFLFFFSSYDPPLPLITPQSHRPPLLTFSIVAPALFFFCPRARRGGFFKARLDALTCVILSSPPTPPPLQRLASVMTLSFSPAVIWIVCGCPFVW